MPSEHDSSNFYKAIVKSKWSIFVKKGLHLLHLNVNSLQPKTGDIRYIANASIIGTSESNVVNCELDIEDQRLRTRGGVADYIRKSLSYNHKQICSVTLKAFLKISTRVTKQT